MQWTKTYRSSNYRKLGHFWVISLSSYLSNTRAFAGFEKLVIVSVLTT